MPAKKKIAKRKSKSFNKVMYLTTQTYWYILHAEEDFNTPGQVYFEMCKTDAETFGFTPSDKVRKVRITVTEVK